MAPFGICTGKACRRVFDYCDSDVEGSVTKVPPLLCPECGSRVLKCCVVCKFPVERVPTYKDPYCSVCDINLFAIEFRNGRSWDRKTGTAVRASKVVNNPKPRRFP